MANQTFRVVTLSRSAKFSSTDLELALNRHASGGWKLEKIITGEDAFLLSGHKDVILLIYSGDAADL